MGNAAQERCEEDDLCAGLLAARLQDKPSPVSAAGELADTLRHAKAAQNFSDSACAAYAPAQDFVLCTQLDQFDFVLKLDPSCPPAALTSC